MAGSTSVFLNVRNLEKSLEFYQALGFASVKEYRDDEGRLSYVDLALGGAELSLGQILEDADEEYKRWISNPELGAGVIVYVSVADVDAVHERARAARATIEVPLRDRSYGRAFNLNDPDGYVVCFITEPAAQAPRPRARPRARTAARRPPRRGRGGRAGKGRRGPR